MVEESRNDKLKLYKIPKNITLISLFWYAILTWKSGQVKV